MTTSVRGSGRERFLEEWASQPLTTEAITRAESRPGRAHGVVVICGLALAVSAGCSNNDRQAHKSGVDLTGPLTTAAAVPGAVLGAPGAQNGGAVPGAPALPGQPLPTTPTPVGQPATLPGQPTQTAPGGLPLPTLNGLPTLPGTPVAQSAAPLPTLPLPTLPLATSAPTMPPGLVAPRVP